MKNVICVSTIALVLVLVAGCSEPTPAPPEPTIVPTEPVQDVIATPVVAVKPQPAVPRAEIEKAAAVYKLVNDAALADEQKEQQADALLQANGWSVEAYQALLYDIAQDPPSRAAYVKLTAK